MKTSSRQTIPSELGKILLPSIGVSLQSRLVDLLELPIPLNEKIRRTLGLSILPFADLITMQVFLCMNQVEAITPLWSLAHFELFQDSFGDSSLVPILLESILNELCLDMVLVQQLSDFLLMADSVNDVGTSGWMTGSQLQTFLFRIADTSKN